MPVVPALRAAAAALVLVIAPGAVATAESTAMATTAGSAPSGPKIWFAQPSGPKVFSPNGDRTKDEARFQMRLTRRADVTVQVMTRRGRLVVRDPLGRLAPGKHRWIWDGRNDRGNRVADRGYVVRMKAVAAGTGATTWRTRELTVDTVYEPGQPGVTGRTLYPRTSVVNDQIWFSNSTSYTDFAGKWTLRIKDARGNLRYTAERGASDQGTSNSLGWDGRGNDGQILPAGRYTANIRGTDAAGNTGMSPRIGLVLSDTPLVEASGTAIVTPVASRIPGPNYCSGNHPPNGCSDAYPCGSVVSSAAYTEPGALSYRSAECTTFQPDEARGYHELRPTVDAPRGLEAARVSMRGKPTVPGETDTATLNMYSASGTSATATSAAVEGESITATPLLGIRSGPLQRAGVFWLVSTYGTDSYDVASFTVDYTYLTPQP